ncbi:MAG TPA: glutamate racemase [Acidimicrobiia bacterium]|nr:glutamate racemase [Acidimicrobiia bacterium]
MIGIFDSGVGGITVLQAVRQLLPGADLIYLADRGHAPYGERTLEEVAAIAVACTEHLLSAGATTIVVACNTASAAGLRQLREKYPAASFVGMEPALKPAAKVTRNGIVGVLATAATFQGELFASLYERFAVGLTVVDRACAGWAQLVERGLIDGPEVEAAIAYHLDPVLVAGVDTIVLGCTHYPFLGPVIMRQAGSEVTVIDPSRAVAVQVARVATDPGAGAGTLLHTTGDARATQELITLLTGLHLPATNVTLTPHGI